MLAGSISQDKLAGSIANNKLANSSITVSDGSNTSSIALGGTLAFAGTSGEVEVAESSGTVTVGLPNDVVIGNDLTVTGDLIVQGDTTTLNTSTLQVEDTLVLMGASGTLPITGGFGLETRLFSGRANQTIDNRTWDSNGKHPGAASNVTGSHSIVFNFGYDPGSGLPKGRWEMDGSPLLSSATAGSPQIEGQSFGTGDNLVFSAGAGLTESVSLNSGTHTVTFNNNDKGSTQNIFKNVSADSGTNAVADSNNDTLEIKGGTALATVGDENNDRITINHSNVGAGAATYGQTGSEDGTYIKSVVVNAQGHVTAVSSDNFDDRYDNYQHWKIQADSGSTENVTTTETVQFNGGTGLTTSRSGNNITTTLDNTSVTAGTYGSQLIVPRITVDAQGRLTSVVNQSAITLAALGYSGATNADNYSSWAFDTTSNGTNQSVGSGGVIKFAAGTGMQVDHTGNTITFSNTDTQLNNDNDTITILTADSGGNTGAGTITIQGGSNITTQRSSNNIVINNDAPDQTVSLTGSGATSVSGTYPNFTISSTDNNTEYTANAAKGTALVSGQFRMSGQFDSNFSVSGDISATGDVIAFSSSDESLKENVVVIPNALDKVKVMRGVMFDWKDGKGHDTGVIAQDVQEVLPEVVKEREDGTLGVRYEKMIGVLIEAVKELSAELEELKSINK
tara:strand:- start:1019 stop:3055 length:2037 start_codon:yes stop_codon:yes gene_type:complete